MHNHGKTTDDRGLFMVLTAIRTRKIKNASPPKKQTKNNHAFTFIHFFKIKLFILLTLRTMKAEQIKTYKVPLLPLQGI